MNHRILRILRYCAYGVSTIIVTGCSWLSPHVVSPSQAFNGFVMLSTPQKDGAAVGKRSRVIGGTIDANERVVPPVDGVQTICADSLGGMTAISRSGKGLDIASEVAAYFKGVLRLQDQTDYNIQMDGLCVLQAENSSDLPIVPNTNMVVEALVARSFTAVKVNTLDTNLATDITQRISSATNLAVLNARVAASANSNQVTVTLGENIVVAVRIVKSRLRSRNPLTVQFSNEPTAYAERADGTKTEYQLTIGPPMHSEAERSNNAREIAADIYRCCVIVKVENLSQSSGSYIHQYGKIYCPAVSKVSGDHGVYAEPRYFQRTGEDILYSNHSSESRSLLRGTLGNLRTSCTLPQMANGTVPLNELVYELDGIGSMD